MSKKQSNDELILNLKKEVEEKKRNLKSSEKFSPKTNCSLQLNNERFNLNTLDKSTLLRLLAELQSLKTGLFEIFPEETLEISGFPISLWIEDLKSKFNNLNRSLEANRLRALEDRLHSLLSIDKKVELEIEDLKNQI